MRSGGPSCTRVPAPDCMLETTDHTMHACMHTCGDLLQRRSNGRSDQALWRQRTGGHEHMHRAAISHHQPSGAGETPNHNNTVHSNVTEMHEIAITPPLGVASPPGVKHRDLLVLGGKTNRRAWAVLQLLRVSHRVPRPDRAFPRVRVTTGHYFLLGNLTCCNGGPAPPG